MVHRSESELSLDKILFEKRNKAYGAFEIRGIYNSYLRKSILIAASLFTLALAAPKIIHFIKGEEPIQEEEFKITEVILTEPPPIDPKTTPPPPPPKVQRPSAPKVASTQFLPPKILEDEKVIEEKEPPTQEELKDSNPGEVTQEGENENLNEVIIAGDGGGNAEVGDVEAPLVYVGEMPAFQGDYYKFLGKNLNYPRNSEAMKKKIQGKVYVKFVVEKDGSITDIKVVKGLHPELDAEAVRVIKLMDKKWSAGKNNGNPVRVYKSLDILFKLNE